uniref:hypothetical protein n=1 Tax=Aldersonia kunmingensis TaxID=408066 RepID=UPI000AF7D5C6
MTDSSWALDSVYGTPAHPRFSQPFPLTAAQRGLWFAQYLAPQSPIVIANYVEIRGALDIDLLEQASLAGAQEFGSSMLRLVEIDDQPHQVVDLTLDVPLARVDVRDAPDPVAAAR